MLAEVAKSLFSGLSDRQFAIILVVAFVLTVMVISLLFLYAKDISEAESAARSALRAAPAILPGPAAF